MYLTHFKTDQILDCMAYYDDYCFKLYNILSVFMIVHVHYNTLWRARLFTLYLLVMIILIWIGQYNIYQQLSTAHVVASTLIF